MSAGLPEILHRSRFRTQSRYAFRPSLIVYRPCTVYRYKNQSKLYVFTNIDEIEQLYIIQKRWNRCRVSNLYYRGPHSHRTYIIVSKSVIDHNNYCIISQFFFFGEMLKEKRKKSLLIFNHFFRVLSR